MSIFKKIMTPVELPHWFMDLLMAIPRILCGFFLACMFGGDKFGVPWSIADTGLGLFEVVDWFPKDVAAFGGIFAQAPEFFAWLGAGSEAVGGMFLLLGLFTRPASFLIACTMLVAIFFQKWGQGLWNMLPALGFLWVALYNLILGGGRLSIDHILVKYNPRIFFTKQKAVLASACILISFPGFVCAQITGEGYVITENYSLDYFDGLELGLNADYEVVRSERAFVEISAQKNMIPYVKREVINGTLILNQKEWIEPTKPIKVTIGMPKIRKISLSSWSEVKALTLNEDTLSIEASVGRFILKGKVVNLKIQTGQSKIDASNLVASYAEVKATGYADLKLNVVEEAVLDVDINKVTLQWAQKPLKTIGTDPTSTAEGVQKAYFDTRYIDIVIKNNSFNRNHFFVVGPKPDNTTFSYGFPMMPGQKRDERWTIGTTIYKMNSGGGKMLICTIMADDENKEVALFR